MSTALAHDDGFELELPFTLISKKNRTCIKRGRGGRNYVAKADEVKAQEEQIWWLALKALREQRLRKPVFADNAALRAELIWLPRAEVTRLRVQQIGELLKRPQRDAANLPAIVLDALQGLIYRDDRQVVELEVITDLTS
jgi:Holliday junction resolvase RusA-like endonuclease